MEEAAQFYQKTFGGTQTFKRA
ncbi:hypothetical protein [Staphylococcus pseudintermedius]|nr:hypothetical protein [Staphylococcus pseudintermedius]